MARRRWDTDERGHGVGDARASLGAIQELADLAASSEWVAEDPEAHLLPGLRDRIEISGLRLEGAEVQPDGAAELTSLVRETAGDGSINFEVVTGIPPEDGGFATHGHTLRVEVAQPK